MKAQSGSGWRQWALEVLRGCRRDWAEGGTVKRSNGLCEPLAGRRPPRSFSPLRVPQWVGTPTDLLALPVPPCELLPTGWGPQEKLGDVAICSFVPCKWFWWFLGKIFSVNHRG